MAGCDAPGGDGLWSCATTYTGTAEGILSATDGDVPTSGMVAALLVLPEGEEDWVFEGYYEEIEGPLDEDQKIQEFEGSVDENGTITPVSGIRFSGSIDLDGRCEAGGTWEFFGSSNGTWQADP